jgi:hypothetical protein
VARLFPVAHFSAGTFGMYAAGNGWALALCLRGFCQRTGDTTFQYLDGLGRKVQTVKQKYSPDRKDVVLAIKYDEYGRPVREYEPYESNAATGERVAIPPGTPFSLTAYEPLPLNRKSSTTAPE